MRRKHIFKRHIRKYLVCFIDVTDTFLSLMSKFAALLRYLQLRKKLKLRIVHHTQKCHVTNVLCMITLASNGAEYDASTMMLHRD